MRVHVAYERDGLIVALTDVGDQGGGISAHPLPMDGREVAEVDVPDEHANLSLSELAKRLRVDVEATQPRLVGK
ncbi:hypothetical protein [Streptomyces sp. NPDC059080]|uniref:hypothetical protein n=1 Tax=Streptomyces sp. NPDC059080 TaxID=3346718 RepID=UPI00367BBAC3